MNPDDDQYEDLHNTVRELREMVKELKDSNSKREAQVKKALEERFRRISEEERQELDILMIVLIVALSVEIIMFLIMIFKF